MKFVKFALVLAMALCLTASVYAETQSVKVSGDLTVRGIGRDAYDYRGSYSESGPAARTGMTTGSGNIVGIANADSWDWAGNAGAPTAGPSSWWMSTTEVQIDAELTDNVSTVIRLVNERDWNVQRKYDQTTGAAGTTVNSSISPNGLGGYQADSNSFDVGLDLAYVTLKNFIYCPLSVTIGRQDLWFGKGFIVGSNQVYNNWSRYQNGGFNDRMLNAPEYTAYTAFDSIKATLDYDPWTITGIYSKISANAIAVNDDVDLWGVNLGYKFDCYKAEAEAYWFFKYDNSVEKWTNVKGTGNDIHTIGMRGSVDPIENVTLAGEAAYQAGSYIGDRMQVRAMDRSAFALDFSGEYRGLDQYLPWKPKVGTEYIYYSGDRQTEDNKYGIGNGATTKSGVYTGWDPMFRGKFDSAIREFVGTYYSSYDYQFNATGIPSTGDASYTNQSQIIFSGSVQPMDCLTVKGNANMFWAIEPLISSRIDMNNFAVLPVGANAAGDFANKGYIGTEFDLQAIWDYTEDVSFGVLAAWFAPSTEIYKNADKVASDIVGTCKVSF